MAKLLKLLFITTAMIVLTLNNCEGQGIMAKEYFRYFEKVTMWQKTVFRLKHSIVEDCALTCLNMGGKCKSFVFSRITGNCYGLPVDLKGGAKYARKSNHYDLYCTIARKVVPYWEAGNRHPDEPEFVDVGLLPPTTTTTTAPTTTTTTTTTEATTTVCIKEAPMILYMASSYYWQYTPDNADPKTGTGWLANVNDENQYLEMDIRELKDVASITTYGARYLLSSEFVTSYKVQYLQDKMGEYRMFQENGRDKIFSGNSDATYPVIHMFEKGQLRALKIRIVPVTYYDNIMLKASAEVYC